ncbi:MAG: hypothetical protein DME50_09415, partial [Verrucomicrobia bacterium]
ENAFVVDAACLQLLLDHALTLSRKIGAWRGSLPAPGRSNRGENQKLQCASHIKNVVHTRVTRKPVAAELCATECALVTMIQLSENCSDQ